MKTQLNLIGCSCALCGKGADGVKAAESIQSQAVSSGLTSLCYPLLCPLLDGPSPLKASRFNYCAPQGQKRLFFFLYVAMGGFVVELNGARCCLYDVVG